MEAFGRLWSKTRIDGCRYGLKDPVTGLLLLKPWSIWTTSRLFCDRFHGKTCTGDHEHGVIQGKLTAYTAYYPSAMCRAIAQLWKARHETPLQTLSGAELWAKLNGECPTTPLVNESLLSLDVSPASWAASVRPSMVPNCPVTADKLVLWAKGMLPESSSMLLSHLRNVRWPKTVRKNVLPKDVDHLRACALGAVSNFGRGLWLSKYSYRNVTLCRDLGKTVKSLVPDFTYATVQLKAHFASRLHVDSNNMGPSLICALGNFTGGRLWIYDPAGDVELVVEDKLYGWPHQKVGDQISGRWHDIKNKCLFFDGTIPHMT